MKKNIPEIDDLLDGINDPDIMLHPKTPESESVCNNQEEKTPDPPSEINKGATNEDSPMQSTVTENDKCWDDFLAHLAASDMRNDKDDRSSASSTVTLPTRLMTATSATDVARIL